MVRIRQNVTVITTMTSQLQLPVAHVKVIAIVGGYPRP